MKKQEIKHAVIEHIHVAWKEPISHRVFYADPNLIAGRHEFLFFIKPEITLKDEHISLDRILTMLLDNIEKFDLHIRDIRILGAEYLDQHNIIAKHYGVINALSRKPMEHMTSEAHEKFRSSFGQEPADASILGSIEFLEHFPSFNPVSLDELWQQSQGIKLSGGAYCARVTIDGETLFLVNGFHPRQLEHFTAKGRSIVAFALTGNLDWKAARNAFIGKTNPADAATGSLRNELLTNREWFGLESVSASRNGFHLSAGPVEGLVELQRYCSDFEIGNLKEISDFTFGRQLAEHFNHEQISRIVQNVTVNHKGQRISIFDLTEEQNSDAAISLMKESDLV
jgi:hypothetical protein